MLNNTKNLKYNYRLFAQCIPVKGFCRSVIVDVLRHRFHFIPNSLFNILTQYKNKSIEQIIEKFENSEIPILNDYFNYLQEQELIFPIEQFARQKFPDLSLSWDFPSLCSNSIIDIAKDSQYNIDKALQKLSSIGCFHLQIRVFDEISIQELKALINKATDLSFRTIQILVNKKKEESIDNYVQMMKDNWKIAKLEIFNAKENKIFPVIGLYCMAISYSRKLQNTDQCGQIMSDYFAVSMDHITESQHFNSCLNRKICIDKKGEVKNCPSMEKNFGHINDLDLSKLLQNKEFTKLWMIRKDDIDVCKDCEFRYICTDCRCFIKDSNNIFSQPDKCKYNPYIAKWEKSEGYITVDEWKNCNPQWEKKVRRTLLVKQPIQFNQMEFLCD
jgi:Predicted Fe-S oxidoreductases